ncbi:protein translocase subunit SecDF [Zobellella taiwanensis]|uniref:Multifunctional fusion protein n=1 Tax=Zobellella taiwanensis TaxID=347535 RepID=A0A2P7RAM8_9GAMM|nr:protein translocase subunit SecD [Zobellella taiwanensis]PSJ47230.1 protein translocase subunit SecDF [Zobellella taiwanensis]
MTSLRTRAVLYGLVIVLGLLSALPNVLPARLADRLPDWYSANTLSLGLDLQGGSQLLLETDTTELLAAEHRRLADEAAAALNEAGIAHARPRVDAGGVELAPRNPARLAEALELLRGLARDDASGVRRFDVEQEPGRLRLAPTEAWRAQLSQDTVERTLEVVRRRLDETGLVEPGITRQGDSGILVQMPGVADPAEIRSLLGTTARMSFHWVAREGTAGQAVITVPAAAGEGGYRLERRVAMAGERIRDAHMAFSPATGEPVVSFKLDNEGARRFGELTRDNIGRALAIVLDNQVITAPVIRSAIPGGSGEISGRFTTGEASELALLLRAGALPAPLLVLEERTVGPDLGSDAIAMGLGTGLLGAALVVGFMLGVYGRWGLIACVGLAVNIGLVFGILSLLGATLTLPGIAGIILTVGMAVDANILINERIREESRRGRSAAMALREGFGRAYGTILDSNFTTLIAVSLLFLFGSGPVKGFAVTIGIGLLTSLFTAISVTRLLMEWRVKGRERAPLNLGGSRLLERLAGWRPDFLRGRYLGLAASAVLSVASLALFVQPGLKYGVDFTGGTLVEVRAPALAVEPLRETLHDHQLADAAIQEVGEGRFLIRLPVAQGGADQVAGLKAAVLSAEPDAKFPRVDMVGAKVSGGFFEATVLAILLAGGGMLLYLWYRFESHFALAATLTIVLDLTKTIGFFVLAGVEFNLTAVAALLALIGYSVNDKVVVFDRVRENLRLTPDKPMLALLNDSISATLTRTLFTSFSTFLALLPMGLAGGSAVASFALPMLFGILVGTSSSVFIASPLLYFLGRRRQRQGKAQLRPTAEEMRKELDLLP